MLQGNMHDLVKDISNYCRRDVEGRDALLQKIVDELSKGTFDLNLHHDDRGRYPIHIAVGAMNLEMLKFLIGKGADVNKQMAGDSVNSLLPLGLAIRKYVRAKSIDRSIDSDSDAGIPLESIKMLLANGANPNQLCSGSRKKVEDSSPMHEIIDGRYAELIPVFLKHSKVDINVNVRVGSRGYSLLHMAVAAGNIEAVEALLKREDIDVNVKYGEEDTPLKLAININNPAMVKILMEDDRVKNAMTEGDIISARQVLQDSTEQLQNAREVLNLISPQKDRQAYRSYGEEDTPLKRAINLKNPAMVETLMKDDQVKNAMTEDDILSARQVLQDSTEQLQKAREVLNLISPQKDRQVYRSVSTDLENLLEMYRSDMPFILKIILDVVVYFCKWWQGPNDALHPLASAAIPSGDSQADITIASSVQQAVNNPASDKIASAR
jgi:ankyrin repeat protein